MRRPAVVGTLLLFLSLLHPVTTLFATPTPPYVIVNHTTRECTESILGDDCRWCDPPPGWEVLGLSSGNQCPDGYTRVERIDMQCRAYKNEFCCTLGAPGPGACEDMVLHATDRLCAFVENIQECILPEGWASRPPDVDPAGWRCPPGHRWAGSVACLEPTAGGEPGAIPEPITTTRPGTGVLARTATLLAGVCLGAVLIAVAGAGLLLALIVARRGRT